MQPMKPEELKAVQRLMRAFTAWVIEVGRAIKDGDTELSGGEDFYSDRAAKRLRYRAPDRREDEAGSMLRLLKFYGRGYRAPLYDIAAVAARAVKGIATGTMDDESIHREFVLGRLRVVDPAADPEEEGHLG